MGQILSIWGVVRFRFRTFLYSQKYCKKYNSPKKQSSQLAGAPLEPLGYHRMSRLSMDIRLSINCLSE
nr:MAG TPA: hypothetical protein [Caudoviricetes sp.]